MAGINAYAASAGGNSFKKMTVLMSSGLSWFGVRSFSPQKLWTSEKCFPSCFNVLRSNGVNFFFYMDMVRQWDTHGFKCHFTASKEKKMALHLILIVHDTVHFMAHYTEWGAGEFSRGFKYKKGHISVSLPPYCKTSRRRIQTEVIKIKATWILI